MKGKQTAFIYDWQSAGAYRWLSWLFQAGGRLLGDDLKAPAIDSDAGRKAVEFTQSFFTKGGWPSNTSIKTHAPIPTACSSPARWPWPSPATS